MALAGINSEHNADDVIGEMLEKGLMDKKWEEEIRSKISSILSNPEFAFLFNENADVKPEAEILTSEGHTLRPDRVVLRGREALIADYKTGRPLDKDKDQLRQYRKRLEEMGYNPVRSYLLYLEPDVRLEEV